MALAQEIIALSQIEKQRRGYLQASLTNFDNLLEPEIAAGSRAEVADALFYAAGNEAILNWAGIAVSNDVYIKLVPAGATPDTCTAEFTTTAPTWSDTKQGFYGIGANANHRYIGGLYKSAAGDYTEKWLYNPNDIHDILRRGATRPRLFKTLEIGAWDMDALDNVAIVHGLVYAKIRSVNVIISRDAGDLSYPIGIDVGGAGASGYLTIRAADIYLFRMAGGLFDAALFDDAVMNRGWINIEYEA